MHFVEEEGTIKDSLQQGWDKGASRAYILRETSELPPQKLVLTLPSYKEQTTSLIRVNPKEDMAWYKFVETGSEPMLIEINKFVVIRRCDMKHKEADTIIMHQLYHTEKYRTSFVVEKCTIIFIMVHFMDDADLKNQVMMMSPMHGCTAIDIRAMY